jgi:hypothetical protein
MPLPGSGIVDAHVGAITTVAQRRNCFIFVRPTNEDSMRLIAEGFATKSMDIHAKSSDWGPMAGFVPMDTAFDKKLGDDPRNPGRKTPNPAFDAQAREQADARDHPHVKKHHLILPERLIDGLAARNKIERLDFGRWVGPNERKRVTSSASAHLTGGGASVGDGVRWYRATATHANATNYVFCLTRESGGWRIWWARLEGSRPQDVREPRFRIAGSSEVQLTPLWVWGYTIRGEVKPVTGDYDLWMVAPHYNAANPNAPGGAHLNAAIAPDPHGPSAATDFIRTLITELNAVCNRTHNPVFRHGAEAQNIGFTQALDGQLALFTPNGTSRMVPANQFPRVIYEIRKRGYLVFWNRRYGDPDPWLMGAPSLAVSKESVRVRLGPALRDAAREVLLPKTVQRAPTAEIQKIHALMKELQRLMLSGDTSLLVLSANDFPPDTHVNTPMQRILQNLLEQELSRAAADNGVTAPAAYAAWHATVTEAFQRAGAQGAPGIAGAETFSLAMVNSVRYTAQTGQHPSTYFQKKT